MKRRLRGYELMICGIYVVSRGENSAAHHSQKRKESNTRYLLGFFPNFLFYKHTCCPHMFDHVFTFARQEHLVSLDEFRLNDQGYFVIRGRIEISTRTQVLFR